MSPTEKLPVLHDGGTIVPDSLAIIEYLEEAFPAPAFAPLWPREPAERARARWLHPEALVEARDVLSLWETTLARPDRAGGPYLCGAFSAADVFFATLAVRLKAFDVPVADFPRAAAWMDAVLAAHAVAAWMDEARKLPPVRAY